MAPLALAVASLAGSVELLTLCLCGALLARKRILDKPACAAWARAIFVLFLPALLFSSILRTLHAAAHERLPASQLAVPPVWALLTLLVSALVARAVAHVALRDADEGVRRVVFVALLLGNANNLPILLIGSLCSNYRPLQGDPDCAARGTGYVALFVAAWNTFMWTVVLSYLMNTPDAPPDDPLLPRSASELLLARPDTVEPADAVLVTDAAPLDAPRPAPEPASRSSMLLSPPFVAIVLAAVLANVPHFPALFLGTDAILAPVRQALDLLGCVVVPGSSLIVGARLYAYRSLIARQASDISSRPETSKMRYPVSVIGPLAIAGMVLTRFVLLPLAGRLLYRVLDVHFFVADPLLRIYMLIPYFMPTASNSVVMVQMAGANLPNVGDRMERVLLTLIFWQYLLAPLFLTLNMALDILLVFGVGADVDAGY